MYFRKSFHFVADRRPSKKLYVTIDCYNPVSPLSITTVSNIYFVSEVVGLRMRIAAVMLLAVSVAVTFCVCCCDGANLRRVQPDDDEDFRPHPLYRDYGLIRSRVIRGDDTFDDYGHLRFGRSDD